MRTLTRLWKSEVEKNISLLRVLIFSDGKVEPNQEQVVQNLPSLGWEVRKDLVHCWCILLRQKADETYCVTSAATATEDGPSTVAHLARRGSRVRRPSTLVHGPQWA